MTKRLAKACDLMGIDLLDHLIVGDDCFISLKEKGYAMNELSLAVEWFVGTLQSEFDVTVDVIDIVVEAIELGLR